MNRRLLVGLAGIGAVSAYASLMAVQALVFDPLAAVPGSTLDQIHGELRNAGNDVTRDIISILVAAAIGFSLAIATAALGLRRRLSPLVMIEIFLAILTLGGVVAWGSGFALGMDIADTYMTTGGDHTGWAGVLYVTSLVSLITLAVVAVRAALRSRSTQAA